MNLLYPKTAKVQALFDGKNSVTGVIALSLQSD
jgi:hypothetical protein